MSHGLNDPRVPEAVASELSPALVEFISGLLARIDALSVEVAELRLENRQLRAENEHLRAENQELRQENAELRERLNERNKTPQNSSLPPSSQHPHAKPAPRKRRSGKKRGGQPGHPQHKRPLIPSEECAEVIPLVPQQCRGCQAKLSGVDLDPKRHQVWEIPEIKPSVTEYQQHRLVCPDCGETTCAELPAGVPTCEAGPRLMALVSLLTAHFRQSKRRTALFLQSILNQPCSASWVVKLEKRMTEVLQSPYGEIVAELPQQPVLGGDETPSKEANRKVWLWVLVAKTFTVFTLRKSRKAATLRELLGTTFPGVVCCDRARMYWRLNRLQWCWAHLKRDFQALVDHPDEAAQKFGRNLMNETDTLFALWRQFRERTLSREELKQQMEPVRQQVERLLNEGLRTPKARWTAICKELIKYRERLWEFLEVEGLEPTNNHSERALRPAVIWRKLSFGTQSANGSRYVETMLSVIETCRQQNRNLLEYLTQAAHAHLLSQPVPSLLPGP